MSDYFNNETLPTWAEWSELTNIFQLESPDNLRTYLLYLWLDFLHDQVYR